MKKLTVLMIVLVLLLCACSSGGTDYQAPALLDPVEAQPQIAVAQKEDLVNFNTQICTVVPKSEGARFAVDGTVEQILVLPGEEVTEGQVLARLETESLQKELDQLVEQRDNQSRQNSLSNRNLEISIQISQLELEETRLRYDEEMKAYRQSMEDSKAALAEMKRTHLEEIAQLEAQLAALKAEGENPTDPTTPAEVNEMTVEELTALIQQRKAEHAELEGALQAEIEAAEAELPKLEQNQQVSLQMAQIDLQDTQLQLKHAKQTQAFSMESLNESISNLVNRIDNAILYAPCDGTITWISSSAFNRGWFSHEDPVLFISELDNVTVQTNRISHVQLAGCERIYAVIDGVEYDLEPVEASSVADISKTMNGLQLSSQFTVKNGKLHSYESGLIYCQYGSRSNVLCIPTNALLRDSAGTYVEMQDEGGKVRVDVEIGLNNGQFVEIISGLEEGDIVYVAK